MRCLVRHVYLVPVTSFFYCAALSKTNGVDSDLETILADGISSAMLVRRESGLALVPTFVHAPATAADANEHRLASPSLITVESREPAEAPPPEALAPAPAAAPPVPGQPGIVNWGPTEAPATDHTALICIIIGFAVVTVVAALIPFCVRRYGSQASKDDSGNGGSSQSRCKTGRYRDQRKGKGGGSSSESDELWEGGDNEDERIEAKGYGSKRKERKEASGAVSSTVDAAKDKTVERQEEEADPQLDLQEDVKDETSESQATTGKSYRQTRSNRKGQAASSSDAPAGSKQEADPEGIASRKEQIPRPRSDREADDEDESATKLRSPLLASDAQDEDASQSQRAPNRSYKQDRATRKVQASSSSHMAKSGGTEVQREVGTEETTSTASSKYGADRASRKAKAQEESL